MSDVRAAVMHGPGKVSVDRFPMPEVAEGAVLIKMRLSGICGTDKHTFRGETAQYAGTDHGHDIIYPLICGHENVGEVVETGGDVLDFEGRPLRPGDRVVPGANVPCGRCAPCIGGLPYYLCQRLEDYGNSLNSTAPPFLFGGWSEYMYLLPRTPIFTVPDDLPDSLAVLTEVMAVTHGVESALTLLATLGISASGFSVAVLGVGPLGICHLVKARLSGAGLIVATDRFAQRLALATELGAHQVFDVRSMGAEEREARVRDLTHGVGVDLVLDCTGVPDSFVEALHLVRPGGVVVEAGTFVDLGPVQINPNADICTRNVAVLGVGGERATAYVPSMRLMAANQDRLALTRIVSHQFPLDDVESAVLAAMNGDTMQVVIRP